MSRFAIALYLFASVIVAVAQSDPAAGILPFSTQVGGQYDSIDLASSNISLIIPVVQKTGKFPFSYQLVGNFHAFPVQTSTSFYYGISAGVLSPGGGLAGTPVAADLGAGGFGGPVGSQPPVPQDLGVWVTYTISYFTCTLPDGTTGHGELDNNFAVVDATGGSHSLITFNVQFNEYPNTNGCGAVVGGSGLTWDGSGYSLSATLNSPPTGYSLVVHDRSGNMQSAAGIAQDPDGVQASFSKTPTTGVTTYTDTLNQPVLTSTPGSVLSHNGASDVYTYPDFNGHMQEVTVNYTQYYQKTNFGCGAVTEFNVPGLAYFPTSVVLADGKRYGISYEATPGYPTYITGRIATITLPGGGYIQYQYSGANHGIVCGFGVVPTLTRTINDNNGHVGTWTYVSSLTFQGTTTFNTVTETDPLGNITTYKFINDYQTEKIVSDVNLGVLSTTTTCYNGNNSSQSACISPSPSGLGPGTVIYQTDVYTTLGTNSSPSLVETTFDHQTSQYGSLGDALSVKTYDFGATYPPSGTPNSETDTTYANVNGVSCGPISSYIYDRSCSITTLSSGTVVSQTSYTYNAGGHATQTSQWVSGSTYLASSASYNPNGTLATSTDVSGVPTSYYYNGAGGCNNLLPTSIVTGGLTSAETWSCNGGVETSSTDFNGVLTQYGFLDQNGTPDPLWRLRSITDGMNNVTRINYSAGGTTPAILEKSMTFGSSIVDELTTFDGLARPILQQTRQAPGSANFNTTSIAYDTHGRLSSKGLPCVSTASVACSSASTTTTYDALDRVTSVTDGGGGYTTYTYTNNDVLSVLGPAPSGENVKKSQTQYDGLGRPTSVCNISTSISGSTSCSQNNGSYSGVLTTTLYNGETVSSTRGLQTRSTTVDGVGRITSSTTPEGGTTTYVYDSWSPGCGQTSVPGKLMWNGNADGSWTCYVYQDTLHRLTDIGYSGTSGECKRFRYDNSTGVLGSIPAGVSVNNPLGHMVEAETDTCAWPITSASIITDEWFSYDKLGNLTDVWESTPHSGGYYHSSAAYSPNGILEGLNSNVPYYGTYSVSLDSMGRPYSASVGSEVLVNQVQRDPAGNATLIGFGTGANQDIYAYDPNTGLMKTYSFTVGSNTETGTLTYNTNRTIQKLSITDGFNSGGSQTCTFSYDDVSRIVTDNCGSTIWNQTFGYDQYDNITKTGNPGTSWNPGYNLSNNEILGANYDTDGHLLYDLNNSYTWDVYGKMISARQGSSPAACGSSGTCVTYDAFGRPAEKNVTGIYSQFVYSAVGLLAIMTNGTIYEGRLPLPGGLVGGVVYVNHRDWLGSTRLQSTYSSGYFFDTAITPYGETYNTYQSRGPLEANFTGDNQDLLSGLYETPARELDISSGSRWLSPDPAGAGWNQYAYPTNPNSATDPLGLWCVWEDGTHDPDPNDGGTTTIGCADAGGHWDSHDTITGILTDDQGNVTKINTIYGNYDGMGMTLEGFDQTLKDYSVLPANTGQPCLPASSLPPQQQIAYAASRGLSWLSFGATASVGWGGGAGGGFDAGGFSLGASGSASLSFDSDRNSTELVLRVSIQAPTVLNSKPNFGGGGAANTGAYVGVSWVPVSTDPTKGTIAIGVSGGYGPLGFDINGGGVSVTGGVGAGVRVNGGAELNAAFNIVSICR